MPKYDEFGTRVEPGHLSLGERLGYAILLSAGYAEADFVTEAERDTVEARRKRLALEAAAAEEAEAQEAREAPDTEQAAQGNAADLAPAGAPGTDSPVDTVAGEEEPEGEDEPAGDDEVDSAEPLEARWDVGLHLLPIRHADLRCVGGGTVEVTAAYQPPIRTEALTTALIAAEKYNRSSFQRRVEGWLARSTLRLRGRLPEYSYGLSQLRPSVARALLAPELGGDPLPDHELLALLTNTCHSARLAELYVDALAQRFAGSGTTEKVLERIIRAYNGASSETVHGMRYVDAVRGAYQLLTKEADEDPDQKDYQPTDQGIACLRFPLASPEGATRGAEGPYELADQMLAKLDTTAAPGQTRVTYYIDQFAGEGPSLYRERMMVRRREWVRSELLRVGFSGDRIRWAEAEARTRFARHCGETDDASWGAAEVSPARPPAVPETSRE
ncbi:MAG TPA: hypothetical protein VEQ60_21085 [Longimicrobium sp.]|nr:hypothetical protein [Longimicrobium sp.]